MTRKGAIEVELKRPPEAPEKRAYVSLHVVVDKEGQSIGSKRWRKLGECEAIVYVKTGANGSKTRASHASSAIYSLTPSPMRTAPDRLLHEELCKGHGHLPTRRQTPYTIGSSNATIAFR